MAVLVTSCPEEVGTATLTFVGTLELDQLDLSVQSVVGLYYNQSYHLKNVTKADFISFLVKKEIISLSECPNPDEEGSLSAILMSYISEKYYLCSFSVHPQQKKDEVERPQSSNHWIYLMVPPPGVISMTSIE